MFHIQFTYMMVSGGDCNVYQGLGCANYGNCVQILMQADCNSEL